MTIAAIITQVGSFGATGGTTVAVNTTGSNLIVIGINYTSSISPNISDSKGNTYTLIQTQTATIAAGAACSLYYCSAPIVGSGHTFSTTSTFVNIFVLAVSGARTATTPLDQQNGAATSLTSSISTGAITPSVSGCLVFTVFGAFNPGAAPTITGGSVGFTIPTGWNIATSTSEAGAAAYKIETATPTENVKWSSTGSPHATAIIASFFPPAVVGNNSRFFMFFNE